MIKIMFYISFAKQSAEGLHRAITSLKRGFLKGKTDMGVGC